jgi:hypothetical protein
MVLNVLKDDLPAKEASQMITHIIHINILYHENKIQANLDDELGVKYSKDKIIELHKYLHQTMEYIRKTNGELINLQVEITL